MVVTLIIVAITVLVSIAAFNDGSLMNKLLFYPFGMGTPNQYYRVISSGFIHADWNHLFFNMFTLYFFGQYAEDILTQVVPHGTTSVIYVLFYLSSIAAANLPALIKHKNHSYYKALGASGGVSAIMFFTIYYFPWEKLNIMFIPIGIYSIVYALLYSVYSAYMAKKGTDNIGHDAHLGGGIFGFIFAFIVDPTHGRLFIEQMMHPPFLR